MDKEFLLKYLRKKNIEKQTLESILYKVIIDFFKETKNIDIKNYIISIKIIDRNFIVKTYKPFINYEISNFKKEILDIFSKKISLLGYEGKNFNLYLK